MHPRPHQPGFTRWLSQATLWLLLLALAGTGCRTSARRLVSDPAPAVSRLAAGGSIRAETDALVQPLLVNGEISGLAVGVVMPDGSTQSFFYGQTGQAGNHNPPDADSLFQIGSLSKLFTETLLVQLIDEGRLHWEDTVRECLPTNIVVSAEAGRLTLYELATHTAGLPREPMTLTQLGSLLRYFVTGHNLYGHLTVAYMQSYLRHNHPRPQAPPEFVYSNLGAGLLAYLIEQKTGTPTTALIEEKICRPLGMTNSTFALTEAQQLRLTVGHAGQHACWKRHSATLPAWDMGDLLTPVAGMYSSLNDLLLFARANLGQTHPAVAAALRQTQVVQIKTERGGEALGWIVSPLAAPPRTFTFKDGMVSGYCAFIGIDPKTQVAVVVLSNTFNWDEKVGCNLLVRLVEASGKGAPLHSD